MMEIIIVNLYMDIVVFILLVLFILFLIIISSILYGKERGRSEKEFEINTSKSK